MGWREVIFTDGFKDTVYVLALNGSFGVSPHMSQTRPAGFLGATVSGPSKEELISIMLEAGSDMGTM